MAWRHIPQSLIRPGNSASSTMSAWEIHSVAQDSLLTFNPFQVRGVGDSFWQRSNLLSDVGVTRGRVCQTIYQLHHLLDLNRAWDVGNSATYRPRHLPPTPPTAHATLSTLTPAYHLPFHSSPLPPQFLSTYRPRHLPPTPSVSSLVHIFSEISAKFFRLGRKIRCVFYLTQLALRDFKQPYFSEFTYMPATDDVM